jgi:hypothetical protein
MRRAPSPIARVMSDDDGMASPSNSEPRAAWGKAAPRCAAGGHPHALTGTIDVEDLLDVIFRDFCLGK